MTHRLDRGMHIFDCDECGESTVGESLGPQSRNPTFQEAWAQAKDDGWTAKRLDGTFEHWCPACK